MKITQTSLQILPLSLTRIHCENNFKISYFLWYPINYISKGSAIYWKLLFPCYLYSAFIPEE